MLIKELTNKILDKILNEIKQPENMTKIEKIVLDPLIKYTYTRMYPYISMIIILLLITEKFIINMLLQLRIRHYLFQVL